MLVLRLPARLASLAIVAVLSAACTGSGPKDDPDAVTSTTAEVTSSMSEFPVEVQRVAEAADCDELRSTASFQFGGRSERLICTDDGKDVALVHSFESDRRARVESYLGSRINRVGLNPCPDGPLPPGPWIVVGPTWAASSYDEDRIRAVAAAVGGEFVGGGITADDPPIGPPASYMVPGVCEAT